MILNRVEQQHHPSSIIPGDPFSFPVPGWDKGARVQTVPDKAVDLFRIVTFVHDIEVSLSGPVALFQKWFSVKNIMDRMLGDLQAGNNLKVSINRDRGFQEPFSGLPGSVVHE